MRHLGFLLIWIIFSVFIIIQSIYDPNGYLTSDSAHYLQMAQQFLDGKGMSTPNYVDGVSTYFATWPIGYPVLIAFISLISGIGVFWASKILNIIFFGLCLILLHVLFREKALIISFLFFMSTFTNIFVYTWSEVPFIFGLLWLVHGMVRYIETKQIRFAWHMMFTALFLFFMRYIGLIGAGIIGLLGFYYLFTKQWKQMIVCWIAGTIPILIAGGYLWLNKIYTGIATGMERVPRDESVSEFLYILKRGLLGEFNILSTSSQVYTTQSWILLLVGILLFIRPRHIRALFQLPKNKLVLPGLFVFVGSVYFLGLVYTRWTAHFDPFNFRLLGPATFMFLLGIVGLFAQAEKRDWKAWRYLIIFVFGFAFIMNIGYKTYTITQSPLPNYKDTVHAVEKMYEPLPSDSIVAFENIHARYLRSDIQYVKVHFKPYFAKRETLKEFIDRVTPNTASGVYLQVGEINRERYDESFVFEMDKAMEAGLEFLKLETGARH